MTMQLLGGRVAIVTGGSGALGRAVTEHFLVSGARVAVPYIIDAEVPLLERRLGGRFPSSQIMLRKCDVGVEERVAAVVEERARAWGRIVVLANWVGGLGGDNPVP